LPETFVRAGSFFLIWFVVELVLHILALYAMDRIDEEITTSKWNHTLGAVLGAIKSAILCLFVVVLLLMLPLNNNVEDTLKGSFFGGLVKSSTTKFEGVLEKTFGEASSIISKFATVKSGSNEKVKLGFTVSNPSLDKSSASEMLNLVNSERKKAGLSELVLDLALSKVAENHGKEMFAKGYLSHIDANNKTPFDRMSTAGISYFFAGENLALAPDVESAHEGLMNSVGHRANILSGDYKKIGIVALDSGSHGKIFVQEFTD
jgi:uncharacterized protein YkwD